MSDQTSTSQSSVPAAVLPCFLRTHREARVLWVLGSRVRFLVDSADTGGSWSMTEHYCPALFAGPPPHLHQDFDESFYILDGAVKVLVSGQSAIARAGDTLIVPRNTMHTFSNPFLTPCRFLTKFTPGGFEKFFEAIGVPPVSATDLLTPPSAPPPSTERLRALALSHHMRMPGLTE